MTSRSTRGARGTGNARKAGRARRRGDDRGLLSTELAMLMPVLFIIAILGIYVVQVERHSSRTQQAADSAARAASLATGETQARASAEQAAALVCRGAVSIDAGSWEFSPPDLSTFTPGRVVVGVTCSERFSAFAPLVNDRVRTESATAVSAIEYWRSDP